MGILQQENNYLVMHKQESLSKLISDIYSSKRKCVLTKKEIKYIEGYYKKTLGLFNNIDELIESDEKIKLVLGKRGLKAIRDEIDKQLKGSVLNKKEGSKGLQPGILSECNMLLTLANILGLKNYKDLEQGGYADVPKTLSEWVKEKENTLCAARYVYYNDGDERNFLIQYGNPKMGDASAILMNNEVIVEIKDIPALLMDRDLLYDENGKLLIVEDLVKEFPDYVKYIERFNSETSIMSNLGKNYPLFNNDSKLSDKQTLLSNYFNISNVDLLLTTVKEKLIAIKTEDLDFVFPDGKPLIDVSGSEIRTTGKNSKSVFTPNILNFVLESINVPVVDGVCKVYKDNKHIIGTVKGRGINKDTRYKINNIFYVSLKENKKLVEQLEDKESEYVEFKLEDIRQTKSGISLHINIKKSIEDIKKYLYDF